MAAMTTHSADPPEEALRHLTRLACGTDPLAGSLRAAVAHLQAWLAEQQAREESLRLRLAELEERCAESEATVARYRELFEFAPEAHLVTDLFGNVQAINQAATVLFGRPRPFVVGMPLPF